MPALVTSTLPDAITQKLSDYVAKHTPHTFPACDLVVLHRGEQVLQGAWGTCEGIAPQADRRWDIASLTKLFTTTCVLSLCSQGKLDLDSAVGDWLPAFVHQALRPVEPGQNPHTLARLPVPADREGMLVDAREITLRQLLTHTSGLQDWRAIFLALAESAPAPRRGEGGPQLCQPGARGGGMDRPVRFPGCARAQHRLQRPGLHPLGRDRQPLHGQASGAVHR
jgi:CubicO group peptidase (beta-lactamase class C family)